MKDYQEVHTGRKQRDLSAVFKVTKSVIFKKINLKKFAHIFFYVNNCKISHAIVVAQTQGDQNTHI
jgi:hypothetical protein